MISTPQNLSAMCRVLLRCFYNAIIMWYPVQG